MRDLHDTRDPDGLVESWLRESRRSPSAHLVLEATNALHKGHVPGSPPTLGAAQAVPGCGCVACAVGEMGGGAEDVLEARLAVEVLAGMPAGERLETARGWERERESVGRAVAMPSVGMLALLAAKVPGAVKDPPSRPGRAEGRRSLLDVERARGASIVDVAIRLGLEPVRRHRQVLATCPFHDDARPSLVLDTAKNLWYCFPCGMGGDGIRLVEMVRRCTFAEAVRELAG